MNCPYVLLTFVNYVRVLTSLACNERLRLSGASGMVDMHDKVLLTSPMAFRNTGANTRTSSVSHGRSMMEGDRCMWRVVEKHKSEHVALQSIFQTRVH